VRAIVDTNILVRYVVNAATDKLQNDAVAKLLETAIEIIVPTAVFCELVWVLTSVYKLKTEQVQVVIELFLSSEDKITIQEDEVAAGLAMMQRNGDFADGVIAYTGRQMTRENAVFVSFDKKAVRLLAEQGIASMVL
jgi:predicted nucleic-acid-binding protein